MLSFPIYDRYWTVCLEYFNRCGLNCFCPSFLTHQLWGNYLSKLMLLNSPKPSAPQEGYLTFSEYNAYFKFLSFYFILFNLYHSHPTFQPFQMLSVFVKASSLFSLTCQVELMTPLFSAPWKLCLVLYFSLPLINASMHDCFHHIFLRFLSSWCAIEKLTWPGSYYQCT